jgi:hypothetical protein
LINERLVIIPKKLKVFVREPINSLSIEQLAIMRNFCHEQQNIKFGVGAAVFTALNAIPLLNKINFGRKKSACSIFAAGFLKAAGLLPDRVNPYFTNPKELMKRVDKSGHYQKKKLVT